MNKPLFDAIVETLLPSMKTVQARQTFVEAALFDSPLLKRLEWDGRPLAFTIHLVNEAREFDGKISQFPSVIALLKHLQSLGGPDDEREAQTLINELLSPGDSTRGPIPQPPNLYALPAYSGASSLFTGRKDELALLDAWAQAGSTHPMLVVVAIGGMGKSALAWHWMQKIKEWMFEGVFWYSFYEGGAEMRDCVHHALAYVTRKDPDALKGGNFETQLRQLIEALQQTRILLVLDGLERVLVAYHRWDAAQMQDDTIPEDREHRDCTNPRDDEVLRQLMFVDPSCVLITSRLFPNALLEAGKPRKAVQEVNLSGLSRADARALWEEFEIKWDNEVMLDRFFAHIGCHGLILKVAAGAINSKKHRRGHFDTWYSDLDEQFDFAGKDIKTKRHHILATAYEGLSRAGRDLLAQIATFGTAVSFDTLNVFNPFLHSKPANESEKGSKRVKRTQDRLKLTGSNDEKVKTAELETSYRDYQQAQIVWERSLAYKQAIHKFEALLGDLEDRGLLWWDEKADLYDLHPVVRGYTYNTLSDKERQARNNQAYSLFEVQEQRLSTDKAKRLTDLNLPLAMYHALIGAKRLDNASQLYESRLQAPIEGNIGAYQKAYELLLPLFGLGLDRQPSLADNDQRRRRLINMSNVLYYLGRIDEALILGKLAIKLSLADQDPSDLSISLGNYSNLLREKNHLVQALKAREYCRDLARMAQNMNEIAKADLYLLTSYSDLGRWDDVDVVYSTFINKLSTISTNYWRISAKRAFTESLLYRGAPLDRVEMTLDDAKYFALIGYNMHELSVLAWLHGEVALKANEVDLAVTHFQEAIERRRQSGIHYSLAFGGLARAYLALGKTQVALKIVEQGSDSYSTAYVYQITAQLDKAREFALKAYAWAWADGEPYVRRYELNRAIELLQSLNVPIPNLPIWNKSGYEKFAYEDEVRAYIDKLKAEKDKKK